MEPSPPPTAPATERPPALTEHETEPQKRSSVRSAVEWVVIVVAALLKDVGKVSDSNALILNELRHIEANLRNQE